MSHSSTLKKVDEFGTDFDKEVLGWKSKLEESWMLQSMVNEVEKVVEAAKNELVPDGFDTLDVGGLSLTFPAQKQFQNQAYTKGDFGIDVPSIKERTQTAMKERFDESVFTSVMDCIPETFQKSITLEAVNTLKNEIEFMHPASFQITGDNLDLAIKVKHMTSTNQNNSIHWFNLNAVLNRVHGNHLPNDQPIKSVLDMENIDFLPSSNDNQEFLHYAAALCVRVVVSHLPALSGFQDVVVSHIPHQYSSIMKEKSKQVCWNSIYLILYSK